MSVDADPKASVEIPKASAVGAQCCPAARLPAPLLWGKQLEKNSLDLSRRLSLV